MSRCLKWSYSAPFRGFRQQLQTILELLCHHSSGGDQFSIDICFETTKLDLILSFDVVDTGIIDDIPLGSEQPWVEAAASLPPSPSALLPHSRSRNPS